jgi:hypothetical protein
MPDDPLLPNFTVAGVFGPDMEKVPSRLAATVDGITYEVKAFPRILTPSELLPKYSKEHSVDVRDRFLKAIKYIVHKSAASKECNEYFSKLSLAKSYTLRDLISWKLVVYRWKPTSVQGPRKSADEFKVVSGQGLGANHDTKYCELVISETSLVSSGSLAATLVHELAHVAGAPGATDEQRETVLANRKADPSEYRRLMAAERALKVCMLRQHYDRNAVGAADEFENASRSGPRRIT